jgi:hypothetical protein
MDRTTLTGRCHCGNLTLTFETRHPPEKLPVWACHCSFCRLHGARATSDPEGRVSIRVQEPAQLSRYRFGLATADFLVCRHCGVYRPPSSPPITGMGRASVASPRSRRLTASRASTVAAYGDESASERRARRMSNWTPVAAFVEG